MKSKKADLIGMISAGLCIVHCLLVPLLIVGVVSGRFAEQWEFLDFVFIALAWTAVFSATRHDTDRRLSRLMWGTLIIFTLALLSHDYWIGALYISVASSLGLAILHLLHFRSKHSSYPVSA